MEIKSYVPLSEELAARMAAKIWPAGGDAKIEPDTAADRRPSPTNPLTSFEKLDTSTFEK